MTQFSVTKNALIPHDDEARTIMGKLKIGAVVDVDVLQSMNARFNAKIFALIGKLARLAGMTTDTMKARLLVLTGRFDMVALTDRRKVLVAHSMSRNAMSQAEREAFWDDLREVVRDVILPGLTLTQSDADEINSLMGDADGRSNETQGTGTRNTDAPDGVPATSAPRVDVPE